MILRLKLIKAVGVWATTDRNLHAHFLGAQGNRQSQQSNAKQEENSHWGEHKILTGGFN